MAGVRELKSPLFERTHVLLGRIVRDVPLTEKHGDWVRIMARLHRYHDFTPEQSISLALQDWRVAGGNMASVPDLTRHRRNYMRHHGD